MKRVYWVVMTLCENTKNPGDKAIPAFKTKREAERFAQKGKFDVKKIEHDEGDCAN